LGFCTFTSLFKRFIVSFNYLWFSPNVRALLLCSWKGTCKFIIYSSVVVVITSLFSCIGTSLLQELIFFTFLLVICRFSGCLSGN
jgi:hypothetical protein